VERLGNRNLCLELHWDRWWSCQEDAKRWDRKDEEVLDVVGIEWIVDSGKSAIPRRIIKRREMDYRA
jgi:hypothetical protein